MPRKPRCYLPGVPCHVVQRGNNRQPCFFADTDYDCYREWLREAATKYGCAVHAYVLMTNHVHLLMTPNDHEGISRVMQSVGRRFVQYVNRSHGRTGTLWEGRHKANLIDSDMYLLACYRYIELNPVRAGMVQRPGDYPWSSYRANAQNEPDPLIESHDRYMDLGSTGARRQRAYRALFRDALDEADLDGIRTATTLSVPLGSDRFKSEMEKRLGQPISYRPRGRPRKETVPSPANRE